MAIGAKVSGILWVDNASNDWQMVSLDTINHSQVKLAHQKECANSLFPSSLCFWSNEPWGRPKTRRDSSRKGGNWHFLVYWPWLLPTINQLEVCWNSPNIRHHEIYVVHAIGSPWPASDVSWWCILGDWDQATVAKSVWRTCLSETNRRLKF